MSRAQGRVGTMRGFTLIELMIVVVIIAILAAIAIPAYRKYSDSGRTAEAMAMLGEFRAKEEGYRAENNVYLSTDVNETTYYPVLGNCDSGSTEPCPKTIPTASSWKTTPPLDKWYALGITPNHTQLYCGYVAIAGIGGAWGTAGTDGKNMLSAGTGTAPAVNWYYLHASCDNNRTKSTNTTYTTAMNTTAVFTQNDHD